ncbi:GTP cyclohydrolase II / 3,4-dihydroxy-2-butanone 4-phosphate synthase [Novosphingobium aromaticivorans DSM 12444]|uniref:3,4-dihydroxy-2-butanone 4-phosphate synthase n=1 Tax=Novosphingobium aromaticivorans (strain ATCC 700278 / DSM 12444 / CCUG 56034 / CIP 105152 / NBRC 16084 / F199) TaxID=279238 RepID=Q2G8A7_NOVAD|nr:3,4-dihydroxy-2-butanone-4-phosphate synthase [Novosphingobium aromaticivorans]ABD25916.1 GTP cyclohydrolase II / 3,4-dihydroxy-2-butanone 4-phosphate synthase [Novosphingobium aromaticivorans DSM 12444]SCY97217.1 3,4-dihydroxy-2-butanone 4-phosphate synthase /GTP cyclohydrolase II [Novosphingobium aromaticivorans]
MTEVSPIETIIEDARNGRPYILVDAPDRENEGDVIIPAQFATPNAINFMAMHARGLICLAISSERASHLDLPMMEARNQSSLSTAFTVSIEARDGVTTGISAHDRAHTIAVAVDPSKGPEDLVSPGHVFPLVARDGGVLVRAGHTEAAVDISRLAGLAPAGVICEIMNPDGSMARLPELIEFARKHEMNIGTIADLIEYRRRSESLVERVVEAPFDSWHGDFRIIVYRNVIDSGEHVALVRGDPHQDMPTLVRVHQLDLTADVLGWRAAHRDYVPAALEVLAAHDGPAVAVFVRDNSPTSISERVKGNRKAYADTHGYRDYGIGAQILRDVGVREMVLLSSSAGKLAALEGFGLSVVNRVPLVEDERGKPSRSDQPFASA